MRQFNLEERKLLYKLKISNTGKRDFMRVVRRQFAAQFPQSRLPSRSTINRLSEKVEDAGIMVNLNSKNIANPRPMTSGCRVVLPLVRKRMYLEYPTR